MKSPKRPHPNSDVAEMRSIDRVRRHSLLALAAAPVLLCLVTRAKAAEAAPCFNMDSLPASQKSLRRSLGFKLESTDEHKRCGACAFFTASAGDCGTCAMLSGGPVAIGNVCDSWAAKS